MNKSNQNKKQLSLRPLFLFLVIAISALTPLAHGENMSNQQSCGSSAIVAMLNEVEDLDEQLIRGKVSRPKVHPIDPRDPRNAAVYVDLTDIARKYIRVDCELTKLRIDLTNAGFKIGDSRAGEEPPSFSASIYLKREWRMFGYNKFRLEIEHDQGHINVITGTLFYPGS